MDESVFIRDTMLSLGGRLGLDEVGISILLGLVISLVYLAIKLATLSRLKDNPSSVTDIILTGFTILVSGCISNTKDLHPEQHLLIWIIWWPSYHFIRIVSCSSLDSTYNHFISMALVWMYHSLISHIVISECISKHETTPQSWKQELAIRFTYNEYPEILLGFIHGGVYHIDLILPIASVFLLFIANHKKPDLSFILPAIISWVYPVAFVFYWSISRQHALLKVHLPRYLTGYENSIYLEPFWESNLKRITKWIASSALLLFLAQAIELLTDKYMGRIYGTCGIIFIGYIAWDRWKNEIKPPQKESTFVPQTFGMFLRDALSSLGFRGDPISLDSNSGIDALYSSICNVIQEKAKDASVMNAEPTIFSNLIFWR
jgi:hypothetical protein